MAQLASTLPPGFSSWATELQAYERAKRYDVDPGFLASRTVRLDNSSISRAEREYNPILQSFRDTNRESEMRILEREVRDQHLNRAMDVQLRRENVYDIVTHEAKLQSIQKEEQTIHTRAAIPAANLEYNIVSNLSPDIHHWAKPDERPLPGQRLGKQRKVPISGLKDFNVVTNRYLRHHEAQTERDTLLCLLDAADKYRKRGLFNPVVQRFQDPVVEERVRRAEDAQATEVVMRSKALQPLTYQGNPQNSYNLLSHEVKDANMLALLDEADKMRSSRFTTRHVKEQRTKEEDLAAQDAMAVLSHYKVSFQRFEVPIQRGYDILSNSTFGNGPKCIKPHLPYSKPQTTDAWERTMQQTWTAEAPELFGSQTARQSFGFRARSARIGSQTARQPAAGDEHSNALREAGSWTARSERVPSIGSSAPGKQPSSSSNVVQRAASPKMPRNADTAASRVPSSSRAAPPAPAIPGSSLGSVYSQPK